MALPSCVAAITIPKTIDFSILLNLLGHLKFMIMVALTHLGLFNSIPPQENNSYENTTTYVLVEWPTPSLVPVPTHALMAAIKKRLPVIEHGEYLNRNGMHEEEEAAACSVCLSCIERSHEIRELTNCSHVFHRECLDNWVDVGQVTCPLCRSMLFPPKGDKAQCGGDLWMIESCPFSTS